MTGARRPPTAYLCRACGETFPSYPTAERHSDAVHDGGARLEQVRVGERCAVCDGLVVRGDAGTLVHADLVAWAFAPQRRGPVVTRYRVVARGGIPTTVADAGSLEDAFALARELEDADVDGEAPFYVEISDDGGVTWIGAPS